LCFVVFFCVSRNKKPHQRSEKKRREFASPKSRSLSVYDVEDNISSMQSLGGSIALCKASVLYLGSAVPIETAIGVEAFQMPCRERYSSGLDSSMNVDGIDSTAIVFSSGLLLKYNGDRSGATWFPIQTLHACAALKAVDAGYGTQFVALDTAEGDASQHPPLFAAIMRRTKGIKVLECHIFICKSTEAALTMVQAMTHAFEHREGWLGTTDIPPGIDAAAFLGGNRGGSRLVAAAQSNGGGFRTNSQKFAINNTPAPQQQQQQQQPAPAAAPAQPAACQTAVQPATQLIQMVPAPIQNSYFSNWGTSPMCGQAMMFIPESPFYPGPQCHKKDKKKKKKKKKKKHHHRKGSDSSSDEEEIFYLKKPAQKQEDRQVPKDLIIYAPTIQNSGDAISNDFIEPPMMVPNDIEYFPGDDGYNDPFMMGPPLFDDFAYYGPENDYAGAQFGPDFGGVDPGFYGPPDPGQYGPPDLVDPGFYGPPDQGPYGPPVDPFLDYPPPPEAGAYPTYDYYGTGGPMANGYGQMVDGLGYYP